MPKLKHTFTTDILFKLIFTKNQHLLKRLIAQLLKITIESITRFELADTEMPPDILGNKLCRLDIHMTVNEQEVNLEVQVENEGDFIERTLFHWARIYSGALRSGVDYEKLPSTIIISIVDFNLFSDSDDFHSRFKLLEVTRKTHLTDKQVLYFFELPKLPKKIGKDDILLMWLALFKAKTEEELIMIDGYGAEEINEVVTAYRNLSKSPEFREMERQRVMDEADAAHKISKAVKRGEESEREKWQAVVADKDALIAELQAKLKE